LNPSRRAQVLWGGLALLLVTNAVVLGGAFYNRGGEPEATLRLSQRELGLPYRWGFDRENSGISLEFRWRVPRPATRDGNERYVEGAPWLDKAKLSELGFDVSRSPYVAEGARYYAKQLPREVLLVLEFDGAAYRAALQRAEELAKREGERAAANPAVAELKGALEGANRTLENERNASSRLFVIDAGRDSTALRAKYADRSHYAIVPGIVRLTTQRRGSDSVPVGYVAGLSVTAVNVPAAYREPFASAYKDSAEGAPRAGKYEVAVAFGKRLEPWIVDVRRNGAAGAGRGSSAR
jgi:hypothetical protein